MLGLAISSLAYAPTPLHSVAASRRCFAAAGVRMQEGITCEVEKRPRSSVALKIKIPKGLSSQVHQKVLEDLAKSAKVPGFRKGKVPVDAVAATLGVKRVKDGVVEQLVDLGMQQAGQQVQVATAGQARLERDIDDIAAEYTLGGEFDFSVLVDVYPDLSTHLDEAAYSKLSVEVDDVPFNQEAYDAALRKLRDQHVDLIEKGAAAAMGDQLEANMNGYFATADGGKGEPLPQVAGGESLQIEMKEGKFMHGLVEGLVGATDGETRSIAVTFPARSSAPQLAGKQALFEVDVIKVQTRQLPEVNDAFAERVKAGMSWADLDAKLKEGVEQEMADTRQQNTDVALSKALVELLPDDFEVPDTIVQEVTKERFAAMLADLRERGTPDEQLKDLITEERCVAAAATGRVAAARPVPPAPSRPLTPRPPFPSMQVRAVLDDLAAVGREAGGDRLLPEGGGEPAEPEGGDGAGRRRDHDAAGAGDAARREVQGVGGAPEGGGAARAQDGVRLPRQGRHPHLRRAQGALGRGGARRDARGARRGGDDAKEGGQVGVNSGWRGGVYGGARDGRAR